MMQNEYHCLLKLKIMRKYILILLLISSVTTRAQWQDLGSGISISSYDMFAVEVVDSNTVWAIGNTWPVYADEFTKTTDGGATWQTGSLPSLTEDYFSLSIKALDADTAWVLMTVIPTQDSCKLFKTTDGGNSWNEQFGGFNQAGWALAIMHFFDGDNGILYGSSGTGNPVVDSLHIHTTSDGGTTWTRVPASSLPIPLAGEGNWISGGNGNYAVQGDTIWAATRAQRIFKSTDKGNTWNAYSVAGAVDLRGVAFMDPMNGICVGASPNFIGSTSDGGLTWTDITTNVGTACRNVEYIPGSNGTYIIWASGDSDLGVSRDGGNSWYSENHGVNLNCMEFLSPTVGYAGNMIVNDSTAGMYKWTGDISVSLPEAIANDFVELYPNPALNHIIVELDGQTVNNYQIISMEGRILSNDQLFTGVIDIQSLTSGTYCLRITLDNGMTSSKLFVKK